MTAKSQFTLPAVPLPTATHDLAGTVVPIRSLSRTEALHFTTAYSDETMPDVSLEGRVSLAEAYLLSCSVGMAEADATTWLAATSTDTTTGLLDAILALSGLAEKDGKDPK